MTITATTERDGSAVVDLGGERRKIRGASLEDTRERLLQLARDHAAATRQPQRFTSTDPDGVWTMDVLPDGTIHSVIDGESAAPVATSRSHRRPVPNPVSTPAPSTDEPPARLSFLTRHEVEQPATTGWRGIATRAGLRMPPSTAERAERADVLAVSQHWPGPRTIAVVNAKGGASKTPNTIGLSATFARYGGAGVLAWDNNQTRGTLGWRTQPGPHDATILDLLPATDRLLGTDAQSADLAHFVHHQAQDRYDVLRSKPAVLASEQRIRDVDVDAIHAVAAKYYRIVIIDSGNDETDPLWLRMIDHTDQLVLATSTRADHAEAGALLLESLTARDARSAQLAAGAVAIVSQADPKATRADVASIVDGFATLTHAAHHIPYDAALVDGPIAYDALRPATQRAWLAAAATIARRL